MLSFCCYYNEECWYKYRILKSKLLNRFVENHLSTLSCYAQRHENEKNLEYYFFIITLGVDR
jgi:hypothetical protein